jgi:hypothetical protein
MTLRDLGQKILDHQKFLLATGQPMFRTSSLPRLILIGQRHLLLLPVSSPIRKLAVAGFA